MDRRAIKLFEYSERKLQTRLADAGVELQRGADGAMRVPLAKLLPPLLPGLRVVEGRARFPAGTLLPLAQHVVLVRGARTRPNGTESTFDLVTLLKSDHGVEVRKHVTKDELSVRVGDLVPLLHRLRTTGDGYVEFDASQLVSVAQQALYKWVPSLIDRVEHAMGAKVFHWPRHYQKAARAPALGYNADKHDCGAGRFMFTVFCIHNGCDPIVYVHWLAERQCIHDQKGWRDVEDALSKLLRGSVIQQVFDLTTHAKATPCLPPRVTAQHVHDATALTREHGGDAGGDGSGNAGDDALAHLLDARRAYFASYPFDDVARLLHRRGSPFQLRLVAAGEAVYRYRPILSLANLRGIARTWSCAPLSGLHVGAAHDATTQEKRIGADDTPLGTELCLEIDAVPTELAFVDPATTDGTLWWTWLRHAVRVTLHVLREHFGVEHVLCFASGNKSPHLWALDEWVLAQTGTARAALVEQLLAPTEQAWWPSVCEQFCKPFYKEVLCAPIANDGFGLDARDRSTTDLAALTFPTFDRAVVLEYAHTHRLPFSVHEKTRRLALPFAAPSLDGMPTCTDDMPLVDAPNLDARLATSKQVLRDVVEALPDNATEAVDAPFAEVESATWVEVRARKKRARDGDAASTPPKARRLDPEAHATLRVAPLRVDLTAAREWRDALEEVANDPQSTPDTFDDAMRVLEARAKDGDWRRRFRHEIERINVLLKCETDALEGIVKRNDAEGRMSVWYRAPMSQCDFLKGIAPPTRHIVTSHRLLELDISAAHPSVAWSAVRRKHGEDNARQLCPRLAQLATDRDGAMRAVQDDHNEKHSVQLSAADAKGEVVRAINSTVDDKAHRHRAPFVKGLVEERSTMETAMREDAAVNGATALALIERKVTKGTSMLSLLMQRAENAVLEAAIPRLEALGWSFVAPTGDALFLERSDDSVCDDDRLEGARQEMERAAEDMGVSIRVKIDHRPRV